MNDATRCVELWLINDEGLYTELQRIKTVEELEALVRNIFGSEVDGESIDDVDFQELFSEHCESEY